LVFGVQCLEYELCDRCYLDRQLLWRIIGMF
jgi:hypothetical protein